MQREERPLKVLVHANGSPALTELSQKICSGITKTGNSFCLQLPCDCDAAFLGADLGQKQDELLETARGLAGKRVAIFCIRADGKEKLEKLVEELTARGAHATDSLSIKLEKKFFGGAKDPSEEDLARAEAFAEKTLNRWQGRRVTQHSEKKRIQGYVKP